MQTLKSKLSDNMVSFLRFPVFGSLFNMILLLILSTLIATKIRFSLKAMVILKQWHEMSRRIMSLITDKF